MGNQCAFFPSILVFQLYQSVSNFYENVFDSFDIQTLKVVDDGKIRKNFERLEALNITRAIHKTDGFRRG
jgi:hypothetical protein